MCDKHLYYEIVYLPTYIITQLKLFFGQFKYQYIYGLMDY